MFDTADVAWATFALGRFVEYSIQEDMPPHMLEPFKQAYLNLTADLDGRERLTLQELPAALALVPPTDAPEDAPSWPFWLHEHEIIRRHLLAKRKSLNSADLDDQSE